VRRITAEAWPRAEVCYVRGGAGKVPRNGKVATPMSERFRLWLAQLNPTVGDLTANADAARAAWRAARDAGADMIAFPEMFLTGYQLQDLVKKPAFAMDVHRVMGELASSCADGPAIGIGGPLPGGSKPFNAYYVLQDGEISATVLKHHLPNYNVFDEKRYYHAGDPAGPVRVGPVASACRSARTRGSRT
jgi:NAD+ synthase